MKQTKNLKRRKFLQQSALASLGILTAAQTSCQAKTGGELLSTNFLASLPIGTKILFQGDSITDAGRNKGNYYANHSWGMGSGYVYQIVAQLLGKNPDKQLKCYNRGISGHKVFQLANRWEEDCLNLQPDVLSILIGVNDFWHSLSGGYKGTVKVYEADLRQLLDRTKKALANVKLIIGEPFVVAGGTAVDNPKWKSEFPEYRIAAKKIASDYGASFIPYQKIFDQALSDAPVSYWCADGVHPSIAGGHLMAKAWLEAFDKLYA